MLSSKLKCETPAHTQRTIDHDYVELFNDTFDVDENEDDVQDATSTIFIKESTADETSEETKIDSDRVTTIPIYKKSSASKNARVQNVIKCTVCNLCTPNYSLARMLRHFDRKHKNPEKYKKLRKEKREERKKGAVVKPLGTRACHYCGKIFPGGRFGGFFQHLNHHKVRNFENQ